MSPPRFRHARAADLPAIVAMLADDELGARREQCEDPLPASYARAFEAIDADPNIELVVAEAEAEDGAVVGTLQLTFTPHLAHRGAWRATIEAVRVHRRMRGAGLGRQMLEWAIARSAERGCRMVQLTTDKQRADAKRFYESLGFMATHEGMKLSLPQDERMMEADRA